MYHYSWDSSAKRPWYQRWWALLVAALILLGSLAAVIGYGYLYYEFGEQVQQFDLSKLEKMEVASLIYDRHGVEIGKIFILNRLPVSYADIPKSMVEAIVAEEDNRFFEHHGVDYIGIIRAAIINYRQRRISQGASTVTQQLARNSFDLRERSLRRKLVEMLLAERIERSLSKEKIMELYLNRVYFGSGFYGVEAAAMGYFGKHARDLLVEEAALLAGLLKSPNALSPWNNPKGAIKVRDFVLQRMNEMHFIAAQELQLAVTAPLGIQKRTNPFKSSYALDYIRQQAIAALGFQRAMNGGVRIDTTFDVKLQKVAEEALSKQLEKIEAMPDYHHATYNDYHLEHRLLEEKVARGDFLNFPAPNYLQGAVLSIDNQTGGILALVGGRDFMHSEYNRALQGRRPPGTLFTPLVAAAAYSKGIFPGVSVDDSCIDNRYVMIGGETGILGEWGVERADNRYEGAMTSHEAVARGKNAAVVRLGLMTGIDKLEELAKKVGIRSPVRNVANAYLGSSEMRLDEMTLAFSMFPGGGSRPDHLFAITKITDSEGMTLFDTATQRVDVISPEVAYQTHEILDDALHKTDAVEIAQARLPSFPSGGKSGTAYDFTDVWFVGYSSDITSGVWIGFDRPQKIYRGAFGKDLALPVWDSIMKVSLDILPPHPLKPPPTLYPIEVCRASGLLPTAECKKKENGTIILSATASEIPTMECDIHGSGVRLQERVEEEAEWPRAVTAIDLGTIRPIPVTAPTVLKELPKAIGSEDVDFIISGDQKISVQKAIPVGGKKNDHSAANSRSVDSKKEPEVRRAEPVAPAEPPALPLPPPKPVNFWEE
jgi:penicillin-binding protein 1A